MQTDQILRYLEQIDQLLNTEECWTTGVSSRTIHGRSINPKNPKAVCWCLIGAMQRVTCSEQQYQELYRWLRTTMSYLGLSGITISEYNDDAKFTNIKKFIHDAYTYLQHNGW